MHTEWSRRNFLKRTGLAGMAMSVASWLKLHAQENPPQERPNIVFIMSDDHASHALSCYGSRIHTTPNLDRIAQQGMLFENCFCTNAICAPSRAVILTGKYSHLNGVKTNKEPFDGSQMTLPKLLKQAGYQTGIVGKWHLKSDPTGFDSWCVLPGQGDYVNPSFHRMGEKIQIQGYVTDIITDMAIDWIEKRDQEKPFFLMLHHKAPHRNWIPDERHAEAFTDKTFPLPETFNDHYATRSEAARTTTMTIDKHLTPTDLKMEPPEGLSEQALKEWKYQRYMQDYLACVSSVDDNVGRFLDFLESEGLADDTVVIYTSDQGFFLGDHGWYDKRFMYEESLRMPLILRYPRIIPPGSTSREMVLNLDFAPTLLDMAQAPVPEDMQGESFQPILRGTVPAKWRQSMYYHYYEYPAVHSVKRHYGIRTQRYKLIHFYYDIDAWELYDLEQDPHELHNLIDDADQRDVVESLKKELSLLRERYADQEG